MGLNLGDLKDEHLLWILMKNKIKRISKLKNWLNHHTKNKLIICTMQSFSSRNFCFPQLLKAVNHSSSHIVWRHRHNFIPKLCVIHLRKCVWRRREHVEVIGCIYCPPYVNTGIRDTCKIFRQYYLNGKNPKDVDISHRGKFILWPVA